MAKKKNIFLVLFIIAFVVFIGFLVFIKTFDLNKYLPQFTQRFGDMLGREISIHDSELNISFKHGATLNIHGLTISDDPNFSQQPFLKIEEIFLGVKLLPLLTKREILVSSVQIKGPHIMLMRNANGELNISTFGKKEEKGKTKEQANGLFPVFLVDAFTMSNGTALYLDLDEKNPRTIKADKVDIEITQFGLIQPFEFVVRSALLSDTQNFLAQGTSRLDLNGRQMRFDDIDVELDLGKIKSRKVQNAVEEVTDKDEIKGLIDVFVSQMIFGQQGMLVLSLEGKLQDGYFNVEEFPFELSNFQTDFNVTDSRLNINQLTAQLAGGTLKGKGLVKDYLTDQDFSMKLDLSQLDLSKLWDLSETDAAVEGSLSGTMNLKGKGFIINPLPPTLNGDAYFELTEGRIVDVNVMKMAINSIANRLPVFGPFLLWKNIDEDEDWFKRAFGEKDTVIDKIMINADIRRGTVFLKSTELTTPDFLINGQGTIDPNLNIEFPMNIYIKEELSASMIDKTEELSGLLDEENRLLIPGTLRGPLPNPQPPFFYPDEKYLKKKLLASAAQGQIKEVLEKEPELKGVLNALFGGGATSQESSESDQSNTTSPPAEQQILENILDTLF